MKKKLVINIIKYAFLIIVSIVSIFPLYYMASGATNTSVEVLRGTLIPGSSLVENFKTLLADYDISGYSEHVTGEGPIEAARVG